MGRFQEPEHIAQVAMFLASDQSSEMTGQAINVTGGMVME
jgi:NAD(P)-dependent dehydrogenase (short-subunit alcohol dehydrogenase family)